MNSFELNITVIVEIIVAAAAIVADSRSMTKVKLSCWQCYVLLRSFFCSLESKDVLVCVYLYDGFKSGLFKFTLRGQE